jgi:tetratricopeptide (TPR) repeat protein
MKYFLYIFGFTLLTLLRMEAQATLRLLVNYSDTDTIAPGDPFVLELQLFNADAEYANIHNSAVRENLAILEEEFTQGLWTQEEYDAEKEVLENSIKLIDPLSIAGSSLLTGLQILLDDARLSYEDFVRCSGYPTEEEYILEDYGRMSMLFGFAPEETSIWNVGTHTLVITVDTLRSNTTTLVIVAAGTEVESSKSKLIHLAYFHLDCGDPAEALIIADQLLTSTPQDLDAMTLKADAYLAVENFAQALEWYQSTLRAFQIQQPDSYELPEYLLSQITALMERE